MSIRYTLFSGKQRIEEHFQAETRPEAESVFRPRYNAAPGAEMPVVLMSKTRETGIGALTWGLIPREATDSSVGEKLYNAPKEELAKKPEFKKPFQRKRCIIPVNGFFEWKQLESVVIPFYIRLLSRELFGFAGIFDKWTSPEGTDHYTFSIVTTPANALVQPLSTRMPAILEPEHYDFWLDPMNSDPEELDAVLQPYSTDQMATYRVSNEVNSADVDHEKLVQPVMEK